MWKQGKAQNGKANSGNHLCHKNARPVFANMRWNFNLLGAWSNCFFVVVKILIYRGKTSAYDNNIFLKAMVRIKFKIWLNGF